MKLNEQFSGVLKGRLHVYAVPDGFDPLTSEQKTTLIDNDNLVVDSAQDVIVGLLARDFTNYMPFYIGIGDGGDIDPATGFDTGARVPPAATDSSLRSVVARIPICQADVDGGAVTYTAIAYPHQALTSSLNELTVETINHTLISHYIEPAAAGEDRAEKHVKTALEYLVVRWTFTFALA